MNYQITYNTIINYSDSIQKQLAFIPFTKLNFTLEKPKFGVIIFFAKNEKIFVNSVEVAKNDLSTYLEKLPSYKPLRYNFCFDKNANYGSFIKNMVFAQSLEIEMMLTEVFVY